MSEAKRVLAASKKVFEARRQERAFGSTSEDVRAWEPEPTLEVAKSFRPKTVTGMYPALQVGEGPRDEKISELRKYE